MPRQNTGTAPGRYDRQGITIMELAAMIPDEKSARQWFEDVIWPDGQISCIRCGSDDTYACKHRTMPYRRRACKRYFSCRTNTSIESSPLPIKTWVRAIYLEVTSLKGVSSMKLHRDLGVRQSTAWFMHQRIREGLVD